MNLQDRVAIITGASSGIGAATAQRLASAGLHVVLAARRTDRLVEVRESILAKGGFALEVETDVTQRESIDRLVDRVMSEYGKIDVLINCAGFGSVGWLDEIDPADIRRQFAVNVFGTIEMTQAVLPIMFQQRHGHIINVSSLASKIATPTYSIYASTKFAIDGFSQALRREVRPWGIHVSILYPSSVETEFAEVADIRRKTKVHMPHRFVLSADDVARKILSRVKHPRSSATLPLIMHGARFFNHFTPWLVDWLTARWVQIERSDKLKI
ncbi:MAG TPA: SDR family oxidoreductase [Anaerolineae bacterium]|nr:SDR family oxidoreductase [Anaerolineae bacterium]